MPKQVRIRRGTPAQHSTFTGADGEVTYDTTNKRLVTHDGVTAGGKPVDGWVKLTTGAPLVAQAIDSPLDIQGGDSETYALTVDHAASFNTVTVNADLQVKDLHYTQQGLVYNSSININFALGQYTASA
jgi:hypothetical protein